MRFRVCFLVRFRVCFLVRFRACFHVRFCVCFLVRFCACFHVCFRACFHVRFRACFRVRFCACFLIRFCARFLVRFCARFRAHSNAPSVRANARSIRCSLPKTGEGSGGVDMEEPLSVGTSRPARVRGREKSTPWRIAKDQDSTRNI